MMTLSSRYTSPQHPTGFFAFNIYVSIRVGLSFRFIPWTTTFHLLLFFRDFPIGPVLTSLGVHRNLCFSFRGVYSLFSLCHGGSCNFSVPMPRIKNAVLFCVGIYLIFPSGLLIFFHGPPVWFCVVAFTVSFFSRPEGCVNNESEELFKAMSFLCKFYFCRTIMWQFWREKGHSFLSGLVNCKVKVTIVLSIEKSPRETPFSI